MRGSNSFSNLVFSSSSPIDSSRSSQFFPSLKESQYLDESGHFRPQSTVYSYHPLPYDKNPSPQHNSQKNSVIFNQQINGKQSFVLERSKSQVINSSYLSPLKNTFREDSEQSCQLASSKASQITFSKPSEFIINTHTPKQNVYLDSSKKNFVSTPKVTTVSDDYGCTFGNFHSCNSLVKQSLLNVTSPIKRQSLAVNFNHNRSSAILNVSPQFLTHNRKHTESSMQRSNILSPKRISAMQIFKNPSSTGFTIKPEIRRCLSNASLISQNSKNKSSQTKINFTYISPAKSQSQMARKLSFKKEDVKNPLSKLAKKKQQEKTKIQIGVRPKIISEAVNEYFPEFKIKRNKLKGGLSPKAKQAKVKTVESRSDKIEISSQSQRRNTFIASLDALNQLSEIKPTPKEDLTPGSPTKITKVAQYVSEYGSMTNQPKDPQKSRAFAKLPGYRITLDGQKIPLSSLQKEDLSPSKASRVSKSSELSLNSMKNVDDIEFVKKNENDSSHTTDYEEEIVKRIKQDLGLNFSYYNKR